MVVVKERKTQTKVETIWRLGNRQQAAAAAAASVLVVVAAVAVMRFYCADDNAP